MDKEKIKEMFLLGAQVRKFDDIDFQNFEKQLINQKYLGLRKEYEAYLLEVNGKPIEPAEPKKMTLEEAFGLLTPVINGFLASPCKKPNPPEDYIRAFNLIAETCQKKQVSKPEDI